MALPPARWALLAPMFLVGAQLASAQACSSTLLVDDFSDSRANFNSLGRWTSDDGTMTSISASEGGISFTPKAGSYYYETFPCLDATTDGYDALEFDFSGPDGSSVLIQMKTRKTCDSGPYKGHNTWVTVSSAGGRVTIPLSTWPDADLSAITSVSWSGFSDTSASYVLDNFGFTCRGSGSDSVPDSVPDSASDSDTDPATDTTSDTTSNSASADSSSAPSSEPDDGGNSGSTATAGQCDDVLIDDWTSQSRLTFLHYNSLLRATSDDGSMRSQVVRNNTVTLTPASSGSYLYSVTGCFQNDGDMYGGVSLRINAPTGSTFAVQFGTLEDCNDGKSNYFYRTSDQLGWTFDGTAQLYDIPFSAFGTINPTNIRSILFANMNNPVTLGPMAFYCGTTANEYIPSPLPGGSSPTETEAAPAGTATSLVIDTFSSKRSNDLGFWHGHDSPMGVTYNIDDSITIVSSSSDYSYYTQLSKSCADMTTHHDSYLHVQYSGSAKFTISLQQHNPSCSRSIAPFPETWDSLEALRYASGSPTDIYIPMSHFEIEHTRAVGIALKGFYTTSPTTIKKIEIVPSVPSGWEIPAKLPSGKLIMACKRPNSFAFAIDDGATGLAQTVMNIIREEDIKVTFFTVGAPLLDASTNLSSVYSEMMSQGHQVALHSYSHPPMEGLPSEAAIDWEYKNGIDATETTLSAAGFGGHLTSYFRPPFGNEGARMRQRFAAISGNRDAYIVNWSVDVEDWRWALSYTPEKQMDAFQRDVNKGGNLVVLHYLCPSTVSYLREFIKIAKATGKQLMRVDQCMEDPSAPPL